MSITKTISTNYAQTVIIKVFENDPKPSFYKIELKYPNSKFSIRNYIHGYSN